ncbi:DUF4390 domain-containing protein [Candidatus Electronema sp. TJ]|uniref:DUF4390 domain-containing protein n=1 Tax=Candidatus Electronema sp. TJ TaxID=3401573 RepID=UPI003AA91657
MRIRLFLLLFSLLLLSFLLAWPAAGGDSRPLIADITLTGSGGRLLLSAAVKDCFTKEMLEGVHNGIPVTFRFKLRLERHRSWWLNQTVNSLGINHTLSYDPIRRDYQVAFAEYDQPRATRSLAEAERMMAELDRIELARLDKLISGEKYALRIKATLVENTLPLSIHSLIPFYSIWNFETDWRLVEFSY